MSIIKMADLKLANQRVLIREDLNVPLEAGKITSDARLRAALPTLKIALEAGAKVMVMSHLGRPTEGQPEEEFSLKPVVDYLNETLNFPVRLETDYLNGVDVAAGELVVFENVRFNAGESSDDEALSKKLAALCDIFVMDAFGTAHRAQASTHGVAKYAPVACGGPLLISELDALAKVMANPARPLVAVVGGSKVSTKLTVLEKLADFCDTIIVGGGISNTFLAARGFDVAKSLYEKDLMPAALAIAEKVDVPWAIDVRVGKNFSDQEPAVIKPKSEVAPDEEIMDYGPETAEKFAAILKDAKTILWNGPCGVFEFENFSKGTEVIANAIANSDAFSVGGGGDTLAAIDKFGLADKISYISTGGGAFLEFVEGKVLPAVAILEQRAK